MKSVFVTGTDTGVGKTQVSCALMRQLIEQGLRVVGMKPVASGAQIQAGKLRNEDALRLIETANVDVPYEWVNPYCFEPAIAPHIAAARTGIRISLDVINSSYQQLAALADVVVVEGVGGWVVPINATQTMADVAAILKLPVIMVVGMRLGCLNHALLTAQGIQARSLMLAGWVANTLDPTMPAFTENIDTLQTNIVAPLIATMPYLPAKPEADDIYFDITFCHNF